MPISTQNRRRLVLLSFGMLAWGVRAAADTTGGTDVTSESGIPAVLVEGARANVPSEAIGDRGSPQSFVGDQVIHEVASPFGDFGTIANFTPSYESSSPNGPGFDAAKGATLRGFVDGQFNITMDGIPFQDPDTFAHHSTSYFPVAMVDTSSLTAARAGHRIWAMRRSAVRSTSTPR
jgi:iron complex outermembrane receptor protein